VAAARLPAGGRDLGLASRAFGFMRRQFARVTLLGPRFDLGPRLGKLGQPLLAPRQFFRDRQAVRDVRRIRRLGLGHQIGNFGLQLCLDLARVFIRQRAVPAGIGVNLRAVKPDRSHLQNAHLARHLQHLDEQRLDLFEKPPPERCDRVVVRMIIGSNEAKRYRVIGRPFQLAARKHPRRVAINQNAEQHAGMIGGRSRAAITAAHRPKVEPVDHLHNEARQMLLGKPLVYRRWQQKSGLPIDPTEIVDHKAAS